MAKEYKDSGIPWIGDIPKDWRTDRAKTIFVQSTTKGNERLVLQSATQDRGVVDKDTLEGVVQVAADADLRTFKTVHIDDFVISLRSFQGGFEICHNEGVISPAYTVFRLRKKSYTGYYRLLFKSYGFIDKINSLTVGIREGKNIQYRDFADMEIPIPSDVEQQRIAEFLDRKCGEIDEAIALQEEFIEELKAYKQSVITEAVTRGLNPNVKFKDSGIDWIGKIPQGWETRKIKALSVFINGFAFNSFDFKSEGEMPVIRIGDIATPIIYEHCVKVSAPKELSPFLINRGDILIAMSGATTGKCCFVVDDTIACINQRVGIIRGNKNRFLYYTLQSSLFFEYIMLNSAGSAQPNISAFTIGDYKIAVPNEGEMIEIADYLDNKCTEIENLIAIKQQKIEELKDYKKSIIYEYVTGKKEI
jgi:type I restriction enzyme S subunit